MSTPEISRIAIDLKRYVKNINSPQSGGYDNIDTQFEPELLPGLVERLLVAGYTDGDIQGILGANDIALAGRVAELSDL